MSQWTEIRHMALSQGIPKKQIARRLDLDIKTVRRALDKVQAPTQRASATRPFLLDPWHAQEPRLTAQRIGHLLQEQPSPPVCTERTVRQFVARRAASLPRRRPLFTAPTRRG